MSVSFQVGRFRYYHNLLNDAIEKLKKSGLRKEKECQMRIMLLGMEMAEEDLKKKTVEIVLPGKALGFSTQGTRESQEDEMILLELSGDVLIAGVFDGHCGGGTSKALKELVPKILPEYLEGLGPQKTDEERQECWNRVFDQLEDSLDKEDQSGSTAVIAVVFKNEHFITIAQCGDSSCFLLTKKTEEEEIQYRKDRLQYITQRWARELDCENKPMEETMRVLKMTIQYSKDMLALMENSPDVSGSLWQRSMNRLIHPHKRSNVDEMKRICQAMGLEYSLDDETLQQVIPLFHFVWGLDISRAFGDHDKKAGTPDGLIHLPSVHSQFFDPSLPNILMLCSDGIEAARGGDIFQEILKKLDKGGSIWECLESIVPDIIVTCNSGPDNSTLICIPL